MENIGVCSQLINSGIQNDYIQLSSLGHSVGTGTGLQRGDEVEVILNFYKSRIIIKKNGGNIKQERMMNKTIYYPSIQCCICQAQCYQLCK